MNQNEALSKLKDKKKYIDEDVFQTLGERIKRDIKSEDEEFTKKAVIILNEGISISDLRSMILSRIYHNNLMKNKTFNFDKDVYQSMGEHIKKDIKSENEEFTRKAVIILKEGTSVTDLRNMILSQFITKTY